MENVLRELNAELAAVVDTAERSLVQITNGHRGAGAGTIWHADGLVITNAHVVQRRHPLVTLRDGRQFQARVLAYDGDLDVAALAVDAYGLPTIVPGDSRSLRPGAWVVALGHPWGVLGAATAGTVISVGPSPEGIAGGRDLVQVSLHMRPGHSGGPLVDVHGRLTGINTMIAGPDVGFAVPVHVVKDFLRRTMGSTAGQPSL